MQSKNNTSSEIHAIAEFFPERRHLNADTELGVSPPPQQGGCRDKVVERFLKALE